MNEKKVLLRFHMNRAKERQAWDILLHRKQQQGCTYIDIIVSALLGCEQQVNLIPKEQEDRIVTRIVDAIAATPRQLEEANDHVFNALTATKAAAPAAEAEQYDDVDWSFVGR